MLTNKRVTSKTSKLKIFQTVATSIRLKVKKEISILIEAVTVAVKVQLILRAHNLKLPLVHLTNSKTTMWVRVAHLVIYKWDLTVTTSNSRTKTRSSSLMLKHWGQTQVNFREKRTNLRMKRSIKKMILKILVSLLLKSNNNIKSSLGKRLGRDKLVHSEPQLPR